SVSSSRQSPTVAAWWARISSTRRARLAAELPAAMASATSGGTRAATLAEPRPSSARRTISPWLIGMPPRIWAKNSPTPMRTISASISPSRPASRARRIGGELAQRLRIGRKPGEAVRGALLAVEHAADGAAVDRDAGAHLEGRVGQQRLGGGGRLL